MTSIDNKSITLANRPAPGILPASTWSTTNTKIDIDNLAAETVVVRVIYLSVDPTMRGWINDTRSYLPPVAIGAVMRGGGLGEVIHSTSTKFKVGGYVTGMFGWTELAMMPASQVNTAFTGPGIDLHDHLGCLGLNGIINLTNI
jgi:NADPH-dependent curcumin reductase CurA